MRKIKHIFFIFLLCTTGVGYAQSVALEDILEDIYNQLAEEEEIPLEEVQEELMDIAANPINLNNTNADELSRLLFLSDEQIDAILLYQYLQE